MIIDETLLTKREGARTAALRNYVAHSSTLAHSREKSLESGGR
jgi:hypothetical protein